MEQMIEEVRTRPVIWDSTSEPYRDVRCYVEGQSMGRNFRSVIKRQSDPKIPLPNLNEEQGSNDGDQQEHLTDVQDDVDGDIESTADDVQTVEEITATGKERRNRSPRGIDKVLTFMQAKEKNKDTRTKSVPDEIDLFFCVCNPIGSKITTPVTKQSKTRLILNSIFRAEEKNELDYNPTNTPRSHPSFVPSPSTTSMYSQSSVSPSTTPSPLYNESSLSETGYLVNSLNENVWERL